MTIKEEIIKVLLATDKHLCYAEIFEALRERGVFSQSYQRECAGLFNEYVEDDLMIFKKQLYVPSVHFIKGVKYHKLEIYKELKND